MVHVCENLPVQAVILMVCLVLQRYEGSRKPKRPSDDPIGRDVLLGGHRHGHQYDYADQAGIDSFSAPV